MINCNSQENLPEENKESPPNPGSYKAKTLKKLQEAQQIANSFNRQGIDKAKI